MHSSCEVAEERVERVSVEIGSDKSGFADEFVGAGETESAAGGRNDGDSDHSGYIGC